MVATTLFLYPRDWVGVSGTGVGVYAGGPHQAVEGRDGKCYPAAAGYGFGSVYSRLKTPEREAFMTKKEWDLYNIWRIQSRLLYVF
jgi:hypothetical protein